MAGRLLKAERILADQGNPRSGITGIRDRLNAHRNGRRSGDQFAVYVFDRFILAALSRDEIIAASEGRRRLDDDVQSLIRSRFSYRWHETADGVEAFALERVLVVDLYGSLPFLNPGKPMEA